MDLGYGPTVPISLVSETKQHWPVGWIILIAILSIALIILFILFIRQRSNLIEPSDCPQTKGRYAALPGISKTSLNTCGNAKDQPCNIVVTTLTEAIGNCDQRSDICKEFTFDQPSSIMRIVDPSSTMEVSTKENLYRLQVTNGIPS